MAKVHRFDESMARARPYEAVLDKYLEKCGYENIRPVTLEEEKHGIDRRATKEGRTFTFEYKCDFQAKRTKNAFVETVSNTKTGKAGWVYTCSADFLLYCTVGVPNTVYWFRPITLRIWVDQNKEAYQSRLILNPDYCGQGLLIPFNDLELLSFLKEDI